MKAIPKSKRKTKINKDHTYEAPSWLLGIFCILIFYPPFFRGLFFQKELLVTHIFTFLILAVWLYIKIKSDSPVFQSVPDLLAFGIVLLYGISVFYGVNVRLAIAEFMKYANYFAVYLLARDLCRGNEKNRKIILNILLCSGAIVALIGIGSAIGTFNYNGAFSGNRISSTFQYPNALASYLCALMILALGSLENNDNLKEKLFYGALANLMLFTFIPTFSRGMWLLAPVMLIIYLLLIPKNKKFESLVDGFIVLMPAAVCSFLFIQSLEGGSAFLQWGLVLVSMGIAIGLTALRQRYFDLSEKANQKRIWVAGAAGIAFVVIAGIVAFTAVEPLTLSNMGVEEDTSKSVVRDISELEKEKEYVLKTDVQAENPQEKPYAGAINIYSFDQEGKSERLLTQSIEESGSVEMHFTVPADSEFVRFQFLNYYAETEVTFDQAALYDGQTGEKVKDLKLKYKYLPERVISRLHSISIKERSAQSRMTFYTDAFKIIKDYPILGTGGGGWETLYFLYQSYMYWSTQAHNYFIQLWIEIGTLGLAVFAAFVLMLLWNAWKMIRNMENSVAKFTQITILMAWLTLLVHSAMDFDLSLGALSIVLWTLMGTTAQQDRAFEKLQKKNQKTRYAFLLIPLVLVIWAGSLHLGEMQMRKAALIGIQGGSPNQPLEYMESAIKFDPFTASYKIDLAAVYASLGVQQNASYFEKAVQTAEKAVEQAPYDATILKKAAEICIQAGQFEKGLVYMEKAIAVQPMNPDNYTEYAHAYQFVSKYWIDNNQMDNFNKHVDKMRSIKTSLIEMSKRSAEPVKYSKELGSTLQQIDYLIDYKTDIEKLKQLDKVALYQRFDLDLDKNELPDGTWTSNAEGGEINAKIDPQGVVITNAGQNYGVFWIQDFELKPGEEYIISFEYKSNVKPQYANLYLYDYSKEQTQILAKLESIEASSDFARAEVSFRMPSDAASGKQRIGIIHRGTDSGSIYIKSVSIVERGF